uniref:Inositol-pentakisphosphate 2-kinase n=1 Tax=Parastrongyloides trichosuri TaxID=131310 RepID=A0A0N4ZAI1_PARTI
MNVDLSEYESFCYRGEGRANYVVSAKHKVTDIRIVWRFSKNKTTGLTNFNSISKIVYHYMDKLISPLFNEKYLVKCKVVSFAMTDAHLLSKLPALPVNLFINNIEELRNEDKYPSDIALLKLHFAPHGVTNIFALEMLDATEIQVNDLYANRILQKSCYSPTITFEIKPKQGFYQNHFNKCNIEEEGNSIYFPYCNNCVLQLEKWKSQAFAKMYDFCPLDLYSGDKIRMDKAIQSLIADPHRNMRIFKDGIEIHSNEGQVGKEGLEECIGELSKYLNNETCMSENIKIVDVLVDALSCILAGLDTNINSNFSIKPTSIINQLLVGQKIDKIGLVEGIKLLGQFSLKERSTFDDIYQWTKKDLSSIINSNSSENKLWQYLLAATLKDCSLMISMKIIDRTTKDLLSKYTDNIVTIYPNTFQKPSTPFYFTYSVKVVDLDPKSPKNLINSYARFIEGINLLQMNPSLRIPCLNSLTTKEKLKENQRKLSND